ncbi:hypothetical protein [Nannocystis punicea]|uniref:Uncharacterized protein n=1 Tax=Nannocystis punicea TaxID=2995304 RepID=A0ABY7GUE3_9BACT|nr:hypothetical protein [Nannocystis poenicansa]WAS90576.1 hypothetical protein O0S08_30685 [Nannocystis poenicansa]
MALRSQERSTPMLDLMLAGSVLVMVVFVGLAAVERDWLFGTFAAIFALGAAYLVRVKLRLAGQRRPGPLEASAATTAPRAFVTDASHSIGARARDGLVVIGQDVAAFVPTSQWHQLGVELVVGLFFQRVRLSRLALDARDTPALASELAELVRHRDGFLLDERWSWALRGHALWRAESKEFLTLKARPPAAGLGRWPVLATPPAAQLRRTYVKILSIGGLISGLIAAAGVAAWHFSSDVDYLLAGTVFAALVGGSVVAGVVLATRQLAGDR